MAAKHHITVAEIHENNAADLEKVTNKLIRKIKFESNVNNISIKSPSCTQLLSCKLGCMPIYTVKSTKQNHLTAYMQLLNEKKMGAVNRSQVNKTFANKHPGKKSATLVGTVLIGLLGKEITP